MTEIEITLSKPKQIVSPGEKQSPFPIMQADFEDYLYLENGKLFNKSDKTLFTGIINVLSSNQNLLSKWNFEAGVENGIQLIYHENGQFSSITFKINGIGKKTESYYETGELYLDQFLEEGNTAYYYKNGNIMKQGNSILNKNKFGYNKTGHWVYYYENGNKMKEGSWSIGGRCGNGDEENIKVGEWKYYDQHGILTEVENHNKD